jgi:threonyl-tRNA synthetase
MADFAASKAAFWHSSAHILGYAIENVYDEALLTVGPPTKEGFFYDFYSPNGRVVHESDY